jgi:cellulose synthase/poly-beta-1,6-N-acetylglucosamine synthase-like glycosyltransferase
VEIALRAWILVVTILCIVYAVRHLRFSFNRLWSPQRASLHELRDDTPPPITVLVPMHNEEAVAARILACLSRADYPPELLDVIAINDHSQDNTGEILDEYAKRMPFLRPLHINEGPRGKSNGLNRALRMAKHEIVLVFDADYEPAPGLLRSLAAVFHDPKIGACMGRVVPMNTDRNMLTRFLTLERTGGYQVDQQSRFSLGLLPQYGGTVGGFRRSLVMELGGFDPNAVAEDTDLTIRLYLAGWNIAYVNRAECYEEVPETWTVRFRQLRRWSRGHNMAFFKTLPELVRSPHRSWREKSDAMLLMGEFSMPPLIVLTAVANALLFLAGSALAWQNAALAVAIAAYNAFGSFAPFYQIAAGELVDGAETRLLLIPYLIFAFPFNCWCVTTGALDTVGDLVKRRVPFWEKTERFAIVEQRAGGG